MAAAWSWRSVAVSAGPKPHALQRAPALLGDLALLALAIGIALRWSRVGHGPFLNMFEILASSVLSLGLAWRLACWKLPVLRDGAPVVLSVLAVMGLWLLR